MIAQLVHSPADVGVTDVDIHESPAANADLLDAYSTAVMRAVDRASSAVIHLDVRGNDAPGGSGSGFFISPDGYALTNSHVVHGAREIRAAVADGRRVTADLIGEDPDTDLAVVRISAPDIAHLALAASEPIRA